MSRHKGVDVRILNPAGGRGYTSRKSAERYVRKGRARWVVDMGQECIEFHSQHHGHLAAVRSVESAHDESAYDRVAGSGLASIDALRNLPIAGDPMRVLMKRTRRSERAA